MNRTRGCLVLATLLAAAAMVFLLGINWGLPSRASDAYLFGDRAPWSGRQIIDLAGGWEERPELGADVALNPLAGRDRVLVLNDTDVQRAEIVRRYRLFSYQPDEMITLRALSAMKPGRLQLDPRLYQYGGLWIYPVGGLLKIASLFHLIQLRSDVAYYLDHPEEFGRFYIVARFYAALWGIAGVAAVFAIVRRIIGGWAYPAAAAACFVAMPVVVNMAHEAKPHLPGAVLMLLAVWGASRYVETGTRRWWLTTGALCGAAVGMVLSSVPVFIVLPVMAMLRRMSWRERLQVVLASSAVGACVYLATNPYIPINLVHNREVLRSNFGNSRAFYHADLTLAGAANALKLMAVGTAPLLAFAGAVGAAALAIRAVRGRKNVVPTEARRRATGLLLAAPALWVVGQCIAFAAGKPGEFGRFAIVPDIFLLIEAIVAVGTFIRRPAMGGLLVAILFATTAIPGAAYLRGFLRDSGPTTPRQVLAEDLRQLNRAGAASLCVLAEPAPYCQPPVNLWTWRLLLMPRGGDALQPSCAAGVFLRTLDVPESAGTWRWMVETPISWADKRFELRRIPGDVDVGKRAAAR